MYAYTPMHACFDNTTDILIACQNNRKNVFPYQSDLRQSGTSKDLLASAAFDSGSSHYEKDVGTNCALIDICPDFLIGAIFAAGAAAFALLYAAITKAGRRKKRKAEQFPLLTQIQTVLYHGITPLSFIPHLTLPQTIAHTSTNHYIYVHFLK